MKQMILKYFNHLLGALILGLMLASCVKSDYVNRDPSKDAQIYSFTITSQNDSNSYFSESKFSIDQINGRIFNRDSLPYLFNVDSISVSIGGGSNSGFSNIEVKLRDADSTYSWNGKDSIALHRLKSIETTAEDGKSKIKYEISINIHQQDPYIFNWTKIDENYISSSVDEQKTVSFKNKFITYYNIGGDIRAASSSEGASWSNHVVTGLPVGAKVSSIIAAMHHQESMLYCVDDNGKLYHSDNGIEWTQISSDFPIYAIYGELPFVTGEHAILLAVEHGGEVKFASTDDFVTYNVLNGLKEDMPIMDFSSISIKNPKEYASKYIIVCSGVDMDDSVNKKLWILQMKDGEIATIAEKMSMNSAEGRLFLYDDNVYMFVPEMVTDEDNKVSYVNKFYFSANYGLTWKWGGENQTVDEDFLYRTKASVITDADNFMWIFGGESRSDEQIVDVWRGRLNKLAK